jgi:hypothetical protein
MTECPVSVRSMSEAGPICLWFVMCTVTGVTGPHKNGGWLGCIFSWAYCPTETVKDIIIIIIIIIIILMKARRQQGQLITELWRCVPLMHLPRFHYILFFMSLAPYLDGSKGRYLIWMDSFYY